MATSFKEPADHGMPQLADTIVAAGVVIPPIVRPGRKGEPPKPWSMATSRTISCATSSSVIAPRSTTTASPSSACTVMSPPAAGCPPTSSANRPTVCSIRRSCRPLGGRIQAIVDRLEVAGLGVFVGRESGFGAPDGFFTLPYVYTRDLSEAQTKALSQARDEVTQISSVLQDIDTWAGEAPAALAPRMMAMIAIAAARSPEAGSAPCC